MEHIEPADKANNPMRGGVRALIITLAYAANSNYGAMLQSYALKEFLCSKGCNAVVSKLEPDKKLIYERMKYSAERRFGKHPQGLKLKLKKLHRKLKKRYYYLRHYAFKDAHAAPPGLEVRYSRFNSFLNEYCYPKADAADARIVSAADVQAGKIKDDLIVIGSDWVWFYDGNNLINQDQLSDIHYLFSMLGLAAVYFGFFPLESYQSRITYAASQGIIPTEPQTEFFQRVIANFDYVSLREQESISYLNGQCGINKKLYHCVDPTLLLDPQIYAQIADKFKNSVRVGCGNYILVYVLPATKAEFIAAHVKTAAAALQLPVVCCNMQQEFTYPDAEYVGESCGPGEFLALIKNSTYVITNSFHGMVFSIMLQKKFTAFRRQDNDFRQDNLIAGLKLAGRLFDAGSRKADRAVFQDIDFAAVEAARQEYIRPSVDYLSLTLQAAERKCQQRQKQ